MGLVKALQVAQRLLGGNRPDQLCSLNHVKGIAEVDLHANVSLTVDLHVEAHTVPMCLGTRLRTLTELHRLAVKAKSLALLTKRGSANRATLAATTANGTHLVQRWCQTLLLDGCKLDNGCPHHVEPRRQVVVHHELSEQLPSVKHRQPRRRGHLTPHEHQQVLVAKFVSTHPCVAPQVLDGVANGAQEQARGLGDPIHGPLPAFLRVFAAELFLDLWELEVPKTRTFDVRHRLTNTAILNEPHCHLHGRVATETPRVSRGLGASHISNPLPNKQPHRSL
mmetsp:Transcript_42057/g.77888  ORF Transcript_42057/g.77888 Transcript_42057/m.77888 type:complete len:280 (+) Transcript_42057:2400-3239(+)